MAMLTTDVLLQRGFLVAAAQLAATGVSRGDILANIRSRISVTETIPLHVGRAFMSRVYRAVEAGRFTFLDAPFTRGQVQVDPTIETPGTYRAAGIVRVDFPDPRRPGGMGYRHIYAEADLSDTATPSEIQDALLESARGKLERYPTLEFLVPFERSNQTEYSAFRILSVTRSLREN